jgi:predicted Na+-dependent transporter
MRIQAIGANTAMSILLTASSNVLATFTMPVMLSMALSSARGVSFDVLQMILGLVRTVLLPLALGVSFRAFSKVPILLPS